MARLAVEKLASDVTTVLDSSYNSSKWNLGDLIKQRTDLGTPFLGPVINTVGRPITQMINAVPALYPWAMRWSNDVDWIFCADGAAAATTRRIQMWEFDRRTSSLTPKGYCAMYLPNKVAQTTAGFRMTYDKYIRGQVRVRADAAGAVVEGFTSTTDASVGWISHGLCSGNRIGFGSTEPVNVSTWKVIGHISSDTSLFLTTNDYVSNASIPYVIEDLRAVMYNSFATLRELGGLYLAKGLSYYNFPSNSSTACASCNVNVDSSTYVYYLSHPANLVYPVAAGTVQSVTSDGSVAGIGLEPRDPSNWGEHFAYGLNIWGGTAATNVKFFKYNLRAPLTISVPLQGKSFSASDSCTGTGAITVTLSLKNNARWVKLRHDVLTDASALFFVSTTKVYGVKTTDLVNNATGYTINTMDELAPGTATTYANTAVLNQIEWSDTMDRLMIMTTGATAFRSYITQFRPGSPFDMIFTADDKQLDQLGVDTDTTPHLSTLSLAQMPWIEGGIGYFVGTGTTAVTNMLHTSVVGVDWTFSSSTNTRGRLISPKFLTPNCQKFVRVYNVRDNIIGSDILGRRSDAARFSWRTSGIDDNTGTWTLLTEPYDLSSIGAAESIQFLVEFKGITEFMIPARLMTLCVVYDDNTTDSHFQPSVKNSNLTTKAFSWRFATGFGTTVPALKISLDNATGGNILVDYTDVSTNGVFNKSYDMGSTWLQYDTSDKNVGNENIYIRYTPTSIGDNIKVKNTLMLK